MSNFKCQISNLLTLLVILLIIHYSLLITPVFAADSTASAQKTSTPSSTLNAKLEELKREIASKAAQLKLEVNKKMENKAYVGSVVSVEENTVKLLVRGSEKSISVNEYTEYKSKLKSQKLKLSLSSLKVGESIAALGDVDDKGVLNAKKIVFLDKVATSEAKLISGVVQSRESYTIHLLNKENIVDILTSSKTSFLASGEEASIANAKKDQFLVAKGVEEDGVFRARLIYFVQAVPMKVERKAASVSSTPSASPRR